MVSTYPAGVQINGSNYILSNSEKESVSPNQSLLPLTASVNKNDNLEIGGCDVTTLVKQFGTPLYILDEES
jgi:diaminopimelate decarboxylase